MTEFWCPTCEVWLDSYVDDGGRLRGVDCNHELKNPAQLSEEILADLAVSREQRERGETRSLEDVAADFDVDLKDEDHRE